MAQTRACWFVLEPRAAMSATAARGLFPESEQYVDYVFAGLPALARL